MNYRIVHKTAYEYSLPISLSHNEARLTPRHFARQACKKSRLDIQPTPQTYRQREDYFGNRVSYFAIQRPHQRLTVTATSEVEIPDAVAARDLPNSPSWQAAQTQLQHDSRLEVLEARQFVLDSPLVAATPEVRAYAVGSFPEGRPILEAAHDLMQRIYKEFEYVPGFTTVTTPLPEVLEHRKGVCQDFAQLAIGCLRAMGLAARYICGYIETLPPPGKDRLVGADASHAWFSVYVPDSGWVDFDPTNNLMPTNRHITLSWGRDFSDVTPLKGVIFGSGDHQLSVAVDVEKLGDNSVKSSV